LRLPLCARHPGQSLEGVRDVPAVVERSPKDQTFLQVPRRSRVVALHARDLREATECNGDSVAQSLLRIQRHGLLEERGRLREIALEPRQLAEQPEGPAHERRIVTRPAAPETLVR